MFSKETIQKIAFAFSVTLFFILFRLNIFVRLMDKLLGAEGNLADDCNVTVLGDIVISTIFFITTLTLAIFVM
jgi:hypothetical protein